MRELNNKFLNKNFRESRKYIDQTPKTHIIFNDFLCQMKKKINKKSQNIHIIMSSTRLLT